MAFRIVGLDPEPFLHLHALSSGELAARGMERICVLAKPAAPCRVSLDDAEVGERVLLLNYLHQPADTPYRQQGPIFIRETRSRADALNSVPPALARRTLSIRGYDANHMMIEAELVDGADAALFIERFLANSKVFYIHAHYAKRGCYAAAIHRG